MIKYVQHFICIFMLQIPLDVYLLVPFWFLVHQGTKYNGNDGGGFSISKIKVHAYSLLFFSFFNTCGIFCVIHTTTASKFRTNDNVHHKFQTLSLQKKKV